MTPRALCVLCCLSSVSFLSARASADEAQLAAGDGVYGRFDGDLALSAGGGVEMAFAPSHGRLLVSGALRYYSLVGVYAGYRQALSHADPLARGLSVGVLLEPLFLLRWTRGAFTGSPLLDLVIDSVGLSLGTHLDQPREQRFAESRGIEVGAGLGVPLLGPRGFARADGLWLRSRGHLRLGPDGSPEPALWLGLEWQGFVETGLPRALER